MLPQTVAQINVLGGNQALIKTPKVQECLAMDHEVRRTEPGDSRHGVIKIPTALVETPRLLEPGRLLWNLEKTACRHHPRLRQCL